MRSGETVRFWNRKVAPKSYIKLGNNQNKEHLLEVYAQDSIEETILKHAISVLLMFLILLLCTTFREKR